MRFYDELAEWWHAMSAPADYAEEAALCRDALEDVGDGRLKTLLELGSGGGNNASHLKHHYRLTLVEPSDPMRARSEELNPECRHLPGDMRTVRLAEVFDAVFIHDAGFEPLTRPCGHSSFDADQGHELFLGLRP